jgi:glutaminase
MRMAFWKARGDGSEQPKVEESSEARSVAPEASQVASPALPGSHIDHILSDIYQRTRPMQEGALANYIPELANVPPDTFGIAIATTKGKVHTIGDADFEFTIQSTSKALTYCMALELCGRNEVLACVGVEPSGDPFNAIEFSPITRRPYNPMVNAGAIAISGMLRDTLGAEADSSASSRVFRKPQGGRCG